VDTPNSGQEDADNDLIGICISLRASIYSRFQSVNDAV